MTTKDRLHQLVDQLPESEVPAIIRCLEDVAAGLDPVRHTLDEAPIDDEPETDEERAAVEEAWEDVRHGRLIPLDRVAADLGIAAPGTEEALHQLNDEIRLAEKQIAALLRNLRQRVREIEERRAG